MNDAPYINQLRKQIDGVKLKLSQSHLKGEALQVKINQLSKMVDLSGESEMAFLKNVQRLEADNDRLRESIKYMLDPYPEKIFPHLEPIVVEWEDYGDEGDQIIRINGIVFETYLNPVTKKWAWAICLTKFEGLNKKLFSDETFDDRESAQAAAIDWLNNNLATIPKVRMK
ncbi:MAG TPA: hypothetical protein ENH82_13770 [bacterium]|nr:hypothetical protein [bacterium]